MGAVEKTLGPNYRVNCKLRETGPKENCMLEPRVERNGANLNACDWQISQHNTISDAQYLSLLKVLDQSSVIQQLLQLTCLRPEVDDLWFISTLQKNLYFFPMENNAFVLCCSVLFFHHEKNVSWTSSGFLVGSLLCLWQKCSTAHTQESSALGEESCSVETNLISFCSFACLFFTEWELLKLLSWRVGAMEGREVCHDFKFGGRIKEHRNCKLYLHTSVMSPGHSNCLVQSKVWHTFSLN
ncbi:hypothetical protein Nmel_003217 [Mimus melanotis]